MQDTPVGLTVAEHEKFAGVLYIWKLLRKYILNVPTTTKVILWQDGEVSANFMVAIISQCKRIKFTSCTPICQLHLNQAKRGKRQEMFAGMILDPMLQ